MQKIIRKKAMTAAGMTALLLLTGCQSKSNTAETEALKNQISQLEQQVADLQQSIAENQTPPRSARQLIDQNAVPSQEPPAIEDNKVQEQTAAADDKAQAQAPLENDKTQKQAPAAGSNTQETSGQATTYTMEELTSIVAAYIEKANAATPAGNSGDMETFFSLKQEEKQIDDLLDIHEDELERLYRQNALTRDEYKSLEWELEKLEDSLDDAEDRLERTFGIDD